MILSWIQNIIKGGFVLKAFVRLRDRHEEYLQLAELRVPHFTNSLRHKAFQRSNKKNRERLLSIGLRMFHDPDHFQLEGGWWNIQHLKGGTD